MYFSVLEDPRQQGKVDYPLEEILLLVLCGVLASADGWVEIQKYGQKKLHFLRRFLPFENEIPSHDLERPASMVLYDVQCHDWRQHSGATQALT